ncbi:MAG: ABC transporter permease [Syntrophaceae bacterium]|jgi:phospholipid/cholesterol/gamma-HCH transport system permease protein|nr:ABC transporter permease [Syntrophaceae bacterium]
MFALFDIIGYRVLTFLEESGKVMLLFLKTVAFIFRPPFDLRNLFKQVEYLGIKSIPVVLITGAFTGMVLALQSYTGFKRFNAEAFVATVVALSMTRELGPVLCGLMVSGRVGSAMAAELGTMQVTEQIDALYTLAINPVQYLVVPRFLASLIVMPILTTFADIIGIMGGYLVSVILLGSNPTVYIRRTYDYLDLEDVYIGLLKACIFGMIIATIGCYQGMNTRGGAEGVGRATTSAVVISSLLILIANYFVTALLF